MIDDITRRNFLTASAAVLLSPTCYGATAWLPQNKKRIVVLGGGFGGARVARRIRELLPDTHVCLIEKNEHFVPGFSVIPFLFSEKPLSSIQKNYRALAALGIDVTFTGVVGVSPIESFVETTTGRVPFDYLVVASGTHYSLGGIEGLRDRPTENTSPFDRDNVIVAQQRLRALDKGNAVVCISSTSTMCPPAPYEYTLLLAEYLGAQRRGAKITVYDANLSPQPGPVSAFFEKNLAKFRDIIEYIPAAGEVAWVDTKGGYIRTHNGEEADYTLLSIFPPGAVAPWVASMDSSIEGDIYLDVLPLTLQTRRHSNIYAIGDVARVPYGKSAYAATVCAERCAKSIARQLGKKIPPDLPEVGVACFPYVSSSEAILMEVKYKFLPDGENKRLASHVKTVEPSTATHVFRRAWENETLRKTFL